MLTPPQVDAAVMPMSLENLLSERHWYTYPTSRPRSAVGAGCGGAVPLRWLAAAVTVVADSGQADADFVGFRGADGLVQSEGFLPVMPGLQRVVVGAGEAAVRTGGGPLSRGRCR